MAEIQDRWITKQWAGVWKSSKMIGVLWVIETRDIDMVMLKIRDYGSE